MKTYHWFCLIFLSYSIHLDAQQSPLQQYIDHALASNISLQQKQLSYEKSLAVLQEAKANFLPQLSLEARFSVAQGGRTIDFPIGDLMNPVYNNMNLINQYNQQAIPDYPNIPQYQSVENESINFLRTREHETKLRLVFPIFNTAIINNQKIRQNQSAIDRVSVDAYRKELVKEVKTAYFNFQKASEAKALYEEVLSLVQENLRTTESLFRNHQVTKDAVYSAEREVKSVEQQLALADKDQVMAQAFFNFLLNRDYESAIEMMELPAAFPLPTLESAQQEAWQQRDELTQFNHYLAMSDNQIDLYKGNNLPTLNLVGDYGFQGTDYSFGSEDDFLMGSVVLSWSIFNRSTKAKVQQARIDKMQIQAQKSEVHQQIGLQVIDTWYQAKTALQQIELSDKEIKSANGAYQLVEKKYRQGQANLIELTDARTQLTNAQRRKIIAEFEIQVKLAELEWVLGKNIAQ